MPIMLSNGDPLVASLIIMLRKSISVSKGNIIDIKESIVDRPRTDRPTDLDIKMQRHI